MSLVSEALRAAVRHRAQGRCEYCLIHEEDMLFPHEPDHIIASQHGGVTLLENLALACIHCNRRKGPNLSSVDPDSGALVNLFNPRRESCTFFPGWPANYSSDADRASYGFSAAIQLRGTHAHAQTASACGSFPRTIVVRGSTRNVVKEMVVGTGFEPVKA